VNILGDYSIRYCEKKNYEHVYNYECLPRKSSLNLHIKRFGNRKKGRKRTYW
jgi:hypothetical protein